MNKTQQKIYTQAKGKWDAIAKPIDSLGVFEDMVARLCAIAGFSILAARQIAIFPIILRNPYLFCAVRRTFSFQSLFTTGVPSTSNFGTVFTLTATIPTAGIFTGTCLTA